jgi:hypothetical protein
MMDPYLPIVEWGRWSKINVCTVYHWNIKEDHHQTFPMSHVLWNRRLWCWWCTTSETARPQKSCNSREETNDNFWISTCSPNQKNDINKKKDKKKKKKDAEDIKLNSSFWVGKGAVVASGPSSPEKCSSCTLLEVFKVQIVPNLIVYPQKKLWGSTKPDLQSFDNWVFNELLLGKTKTAKEKQFQ